MLLLRGKENQDGQKAERKVNEGAVARDLQEGTVAITTLPMP